MGTEPALGPRVGGQVLVDQLVVHGVDRIFCVPGESYLPVLDALYDLSDKVALTVCRHETAAANMADAYGKLTGRPGICFVTRGPGATHASVGLHTAFQDSTPLILFVGQVQRAHLEREAFQELDLKRCFDGLAKWVVQVDDPRRLPELVGRAFRTAVSGRPGPVVVGLPEDMLYESCEVRDGIPSQVARAHPGPGDMRRLRDLLVGASRPMVLVGGGSWTTGTRRAMEAFATQNDLPVAATFRRQDHIDNNSENYVGTLGVAADPALVERVRAADLIIAVGARLGDVTTAGYTILEAPVPHQRLVHVHPDPDELGRVYVGALHINADVAEFAVAAATLEPVDPRAWGDWRRAARANYLARLELEPRPPDGVDLGAVMKMIQQRLPRDAVITNGAGNYTAWVHRFLEFSEVRTQLAPTSGAMGYGVPAAIAAKLMMPERVVVAFAGDGCFLMSAQELATAVQYQLPIVFIVVNNGMFATIRMHQQQRYPGRVYGVELTNPDFAALARSFGAAGEVIEATADFPAALDRALGLGIPSVIELRTDPLQLSPTMRLEE